MSGLELLTSPLLASIGGIKHGFFTRNGGVSEGVYESLNVGLGSGDDPVRVRENRRRAAKAFGAPPERLVTAYQVHSARAVAADAPWSEAPPEADALISTAPGLMLGTLAADCAPVLIADGEARVVAAVHAGWKGAASGVITSAVQAMVARGASRERLIAAVGPCIAQASYEVGAEFEARFLALSKDFGRFFAGGAANTRWFDLPGFILAQLALAGVTRSEWVGADTCADPDRFFSNRRAVKQHEPDYGRLLTAIMIL